MKNIQISQELFMMLIRYHLCDDDLWQKEIEAELSKKVDAIITRDTELFDEALGDYNAKQKRNGRKILDYYEKIRTSKQEKLFYEIIVQVGNYEDMSATDNKGKLAEKILKNIWQISKKETLLYMYFQHTCI